MGSLNAAGIPVVTKQPLSFRKHDRPIKQTDNRTDTITTLVSTHPDRTIGSGSIVREDGTVEYTEERVWGVQFESRSSDARVASDPDSTRNLSVDNNGNQTEAVIETSLAPHTPQVGVTHTGNRVVKRQGFDDTLIARESND